MNNKNKCWRQGDLCFVKIDSLPTGLKESKSKTLLSNGSGGNPHTFSGGKWYPKLEDEFTIGYLSAGTQCKVFHVEHGDIDEKGRKSGKLPKGIYQVKRQSEETIEGLKQVID